MLYFATSAQQGMLCKLASLRLEVAGERENGRARGRHARGDGVYLPLSFQIQQIYRHNGEIPCLDIFNRPYSRIGVSGGQRSDKM